MSLFQRALDRIIENRSKKYNCIPFDSYFPRFAEFLPGIQRRYYLISGASGAGKSQVTDDMFVFHPYDFAEREKKDLNLKIFYYSLEIDALTKMHQWMTRRLYTQWGIRVDINILESAGKNRLNDNMLMAVTETREYFEKLEDIVTIKDGSINPEAIRKDVDKYVLENGTVVKKQMTFKEKVNGQTVETEKAVFDHYIPYNKNEYVEVMIDNLNLLTSEGGLSTKETMEKLSRYFVKIRNYYGYTPVAIQQQSAESENIEHFNASKLEPSKQGLGETKLTYNDCDIALGIFQPQKHEIKTYRHYKVIDMGDNYRNISIFKNRYGVSNVNIGVYFDGAVNFFKELPKYQEITEDHYSLIKAKTPKW